MQSRIVGPPLNFFTNILLSLIMWTNPMLISFLSKEKLVARDGSNGLPKIMCKNRTELGKNACSRSTAVPLPLFYKQSLAIKPKITLI